MFQFESKNSELFQNNLFESSDSIDYQWLEESSRINWDDIMNPNWFPSFNNTIFDEFKNELNYSKKAHKEIDLDYNIKKIKLTQLDSLEVEVCSSEENHNNSSCQDNRDLKENLTSPTTLISDNLNDWKDNSTDLAKAVEEVTKLGRNSNLPISNSFEILKEIADRASLKSPQKQQRFGRAEDRGKDSNYYFN